MKLLNTLSRYKKTSYGQAAVCAMVMIIAATVRAAPAAETPSAPADTLTIGEEFVKYQFADTTEIIYVESDSSTRRKLFWSGAINGAAWMNGDEQSLQHLKNESGIPSENGFLVVDYARGWGKLRLCEDGGSQSALNECRWGSEIKTDGVPIIEETSRLTMTDGVTWFAVDLAAASHVSLSAPAPAAMIVSVDGKIRDYEEFWDGLSRDLPLAKGRFIIGVKPLNERSLAGTPLQIGLRPIPLLTENAPLDVRLTQGQKSVVMFETKRKGPVGLGLSADSGLAEMVIADTRGNVVGSGGRRVFVEIDRGKYYVWLTAPPPAQSAPPATPEAPAARIGANAVLRIFGLNNPPVDPPRDLLQWFTKGGVGARPKAGGERWSVPPKRSGASDPDDVSSVRGLDTAGNTIIVRRGNDLLTIDNGGRVLTDGNHQSIGDGWTRLFSSESETGRDLRGFMRSDRSSYSSKDSVFIKGYVRETAHGMIKFPPTEALSYFVRVESPSQTHTDYPVTLNELGGFDLTFALSKPFTIAGEYAASLIVSAAKNTPMSNIPMSNTPISNIPISNNVSAIKFAAAAYHPPRFEVELSGAERVISDKPIEMGAVVSYYGARRRAGNRDIILRTASYRRNYRPRGFPGFVFSSDDRCAGARSECLQSVFETSVKTDENGFAGVSLDPSQMTDGNPAEFVVEAVVMDTASAASASSRRTVTALPPFTLGVRANRHITSGSNISARVVAVGMNDSLIVGRRVSAALKRVAWRSRLVDSDFLSGRPEYVTVETAEIAAQKNILTKGNPALVEFKNQKPGIYILELSALDDLGRSHSVSVDLFLVGNRPQIWKAAALPALEAVTDRNIYEPGQQAKILLRSSHKNARALAVAERPDGDLQYKWVNVKNGQGSLALDIRQDMAPRLPVSFILMPLPSGQRRGADRSETVMSSILLPVTPVANMLDVRLSHAQAVLPGGTLNVTVSIRDVQGRPRAGEVTLLLLGETPPPYISGQAFDPLEAFMRDITSRVSIEGQGGQGRVPFVVDTLSRSTIVLPTAKERQGSPVSTIKIERSGNAAVKIPIPSAAGVYTIKAIAASGPDRFGVAESRVSARRMPAK